MATQVFIFDIQRFSIHDGPGIRTTVFFKGCSLNCLWCHNPESISSKPQYRFTASKCLGCKQCLQNSQYPAAEPADLVHHPVEPKVIDRCPTGALTAQGKFVSIADIMEIVVKDKAYYKNSGGGVTISGGEPSLQPVGAAALLAACKAEGLHTAMETAGNVPWANLEQLLPYLDLVLFDIKHLEPQQHRLLTGSSNNLILTNLEKLLSQHQLEVMLRIPIVPGYNDQETNLLALKAFLDQLPRVPQLEFLPYHKLGMSKYAEVGKTYELEHVLEPEPEFMARLQKEFGGVVHE